MIPLLDNFPPNFNYELINLDLTVLDSVLNILISLKG